VYGDKDPNGWMEQERGRDSDRDSGGVIQQRNEATGRKEGRKEGRKT